MLHCRGYYGFLYLDDKCWYTYRVVTKTATSCMYSIYLLQYPFSGIFSPPTAEVEKLTITILWCIPYGHITLFRFSPVSFVSNRFDYTFRKTKGWHGSAVIFKHVWVPPLWVKPLNLKHSINSLLLINKL